MKYPSSFARWSSPIALVVSSLCAAATGCAVEDDSPLQISEDVEELNGDYETSGCTATERTTVDAAMNHIFATIGTSAYRQCLLSSFMIDRFDTIVEDMITKLRAMPTTVHCVAPGTCGENAIACAGVPAGGGPARPEVMKVEKDFIASTSMLQLAATIVHEAGHQQGWTHVSYGDGSNLAYPVSVNEQIESCIVDSEPNGWERNQPHGDTELAVTGGAGGSPFLIRCPSGQRASGISADTSAEYLNRFRLHCSNGSVTPMVGEFKDSIRSESQICATGSSLVQFNATSGPIMNSATAFCASNQDLINDVANPLTQARFLGGSGSGTFSRRACPTGMAIVGAVGRAGARIDQVRWLCEDVDGTVLPNPHFSTLKGTQTGTAKLELCSGHGALRALYGHAGGAVDQLGGECFPTTVSTTGLPTIVSGDFARQGLDVNGGNGGVIFNLPCPSGQLLVGLRVRSGARIDGIGGVCATPSSWGGGNTTAVHNLPIQGGSGGVFSTVNCPSREFLVGLKSWAAPTPEHQDSITIHGVQPLCRRLGTAN